jgi:alcohol dehydrogenase/L-iditol 2-dehydrogenase
MQSAVVQYALEPLAVELREIAVPEIGADDVLLRVGAVSVCGSDVHQAYNTHSWPVKVPVVLGHEFGGTVAQAGRTVKNVREGDRVVSETAAEICGDCMLCRTGRYNLCPLRKGFGYGIDGAMASYVKVPARCLHRIRCRSNSRASRSRTRWRSTRCASTRPSVRAISWSCSARVRSDSCARGWRRWPAPTR